MTIGRVILGVLLFAVATAVLYAWGLGKSMDQKTDLARNLLSACGSKVVRYLKKNDTITVKEVARQIEGVSFTVMVSFFLRYLTTLLPQALSRFLARSVF